MTVDNFKINIARAVDGQNDQLQDVKSALEQHINLKAYSEGVRPVVLTMSTVLRFCLLVGLSDKSVRSTKEIEGVKWTAFSNPYAATFFSKNQIGQLFEALIKMRYHDVEGDWAQRAFVSKVVGLEIMRGHDLLMQEGTMDEWLQFAPLRGGKSASDIPMLDLLVGMYDDEMEARLDLNSKAITNTQVLVAGTTGSGKSNLLAVLINQLRSASADTHYPVNFLLFDYKGEFSDPANAHWLQLFETDSTALLNPMEKPLPFTPFKDFTGKPINELNLYATTMSNALSAISPAKISANMDNRLSEAIIEAYKKRNYKPITFKDVLDNYTLLMPEKKQDDTDSVKSVLNQLVRNNIFSEEDKIDLIHTCNIINLGQFEKDGIIAKAIVYFVISKLNNIYDILPGQQVNDERVELRHFTIIDEAHYMLGFENKPLKNLIKVGRNKGMSIIFASQNMDDFKSKHFDFYANAQYPLIMRQQQQNDSVLRDLFAVNGSQLQELKQAISGLQKGELITKDAQAMAFGFGKHWKRIKVTHLI